MDHVARVGGGEALRDLTRDLEELPDRQRPVRQHRVEVLPFEELHRDEVPALGLADVVDRADVGVVENRRGARLALEPHDAVGPVERLVDDELQRDVPAEPDVLGFIDDAHAALAEHSQNAVVGDDFVRSMRQQIALGESFQE